MDEKVRERWQAALEAAGDAALKAAADSLDTKHLKTFLEILAVMDRLNRKARLDLSSAKIETIALEAIEAQANEPVAEVQALRAMVTRWRNVALDEDDAALQRALGQLEKRLCALREILPSPSPPA